MRVNRPMTAPPSPPSAERVFEEWLARGDQIADFRGSRLIGRGGMGEVWEAEQLTLGRRVALKLIRTSPRP